MLPQAHVQADDLSEILLLLHMPSQRYNESAYYFIACEIKKKTPETIKLREVFWTHLSTQNVDSLISQNSSVDAMPYIKVFTQSHNMGYITTSTIKVDQLSSLDVHTAVIYLKAVINATRQKLYTLINLKPLELTFSLLLRLDRQLQQKLSGEINYEVNYITESLNVCQGSNLNTLLEATAYTDHRWRYTNSRK